MPDKFLQSTIYGYVREKNPALFGKMIDANIWDYTAKPNLTFLYPSEKIIKEILEMKGEKLIVTLLSLFIPRHFIWSDMDISKRDAFWAKMPKVYTASRISLNMKLVAGADRADDYLEVDDGAGHGGKVTPLPDFYYKPSSSHQTVFAYDGPLFAAKNMIDVLKDAPPHAPRVKGNAEVSKFDNSLVTMLNLALADLERGTIEGFLQASVTILDHLKTKSHYRSALYLVSPCPITTFFVLCHSSSRPSWLQEDIADISFTLSGVSNLKTAFDAHVEAACQLPSPDCAGLKRMHNFQSAADFVQAIRDVYSCPGKLMCPSSTDGPATECCSLPADYPDPQKKLAQDCVRFKAWLEAEKYYKDGYTQLVKYGFSNLDKFDPTNLETIADQNSKMNMLAFFRSDFCGYFPRSREACNKMNESICASVGISQVDTQEDVLACIGCKKLCPFCCQNYMRACVAEAR